MFIWSVKLNRNLIWGLCAVICLSIGAVAVFSPKTSTNVLKNSIDTTAKTTEQQVSMLQAFGYEVEPQPTLIEEVIIPAEFDTGYEEYNNFQKLSGFDLTKYKGTRAKKYTYKVTNYPDQQDGVVANILVYNGKAIGGDISSTSLNGFVHGFVKE
ncbi:MAG: DUF4830 domain-containing protein [Clostridia bacterium]|nr:DUF4830 domain-containing protein [Clostridia bacterium]